MRIEEGECQNGTKIPTSNFVHIIDSGHGGIDPKTGEYVTDGKRSPVWSDGKQYFEGVGNRDITKRIASGLRKLGIRFDYTVDPNDYRDIPLGERAAVANSINKKHPTITWSIHSNGSRKESANGYEVFTSPRQTESDIIATIAFKELAKEFPRHRPRTDDDDGDPDKEARFKILTATDGRAVLVESMFHTNERECRILMTPEGRQRVANAVINAIVEVERLADAGEIRP